MDDQKPLGRIVRHDARDLSWLRLTEAAHVEPVDQVTYYISTPNSRAFSHYVDKPRGHDYNERAIFSWYGASEPRGHSVHDDLEALLLAYDNQDRRQQPWDRWSVDLVNGIRAGMRRLGSDSRRYPYLLGQCCFECPANAQPVAGGRDWRDVLRERYGSAIRHMGAVVQSGQSVWP